MTKLAGAMPKSTHHMLNDSPELAGSYALWLATSPSADFLRGRYSSCKWVSSGVRCLTGKAALADS